MNQFLLNAGNGSANFNLSDAIAMSNSVAKGKSSSNRWAQLLKDDQNGNIINAEGTVMYDDYKDLTDDVIKARQFDKYGVNDLISAGLSRTSQVSDTIVSYETMNTFNAKTSMNASNRLENQTNYAINYLPQPLYHTDFVIPFRQEGFAYKQSDGITESVDQVARERDKTLFLGADLGVKVSGEDAPLYGYTNHPSTISASISDWTNPANFDSISVEAVGIVGQLFNAVNGLDPNSVIMYVATDVWPSLQADQSSQKGDRTNLERIRAITEIMDVKYSEHLPNGTVCLVEMRARTIQWSNAQDIIAVPWVKGHQIENGRVTVFGCGVGKIKTDRSGKTGILYAVPV